jgi:ferric-dicitrate binding protein FerR (iron transport regulator)
MARPATNQPTGGRTDERGDGAACEAAGRLIAGALAPAPAPDLHDWAAIQASLPARRRSRAATRRGLRLALPALAAAAAAAAWLLVRAAEPPLTWTATGCEAGQETGLVAAAPGAACAIQLNDGSRIMLDAETRGRIAVGPGGRSTASARFVLEQGAADLDVVHRDRGRWAVEAGPFHVDVTGTRFRVSWSPAEQHFRVAMQQGAVAVSGPSLSPGTALRTNQVLDVRDDGRRSGARPGATAAAATTAAPARGALVTQEGSPPGSPAPPQLDREPAASAGLVATPGGVATAARPGSPVFIGNDGKLGGPMTGRVWIAAGAAATITSPAPCNARSCFRETRGQLCMRGAMPALRCTGQGTAAFACNWQANWGASIGMNTAADGGPWLSTAPSSLSVAYRNQADRATYRLNAHVAGDPDGKQYCLDAYQSGQVVEPWMLRTDCWGDAGQALASFQEVDHVSLEIVSTESPLAFDYCVTGIAVNGSALRAAEAADTGHVAIGDNGKLVGALTGYAWVAGGAGTSFTTPKPCNQDSCFRSTQGRLCSKGTIAALQCTGQGTPQLSCDWASNWGAMIGLNPSAAGDAWGPAAPSTLALTFAGLPAVYRLMVHVAGEPEADSYCLDGYQSGQPVDARTLRSRCWSPGGEPLASFQKVDRIGLQILAAETPVPFDLCISDIVAR